MIELDRQQLPRNGASVPQPQQPRSEHAPPSEQAKRCAMLQEKNTQLRQEIERFNRQLVQREQEIDLLRQRFDDLFSVLRQMRQEEVRLPTFQARSTLKHQRFQAYASLLRQFEDEHDREEVNLEPLALNVWLVTRNRFVDKIIGHFARIRDRVVVIRDYALVEQLMSLGIFPDIIITGAYDFGLDDPEHSKLSQFFDQVLQDSFEGTEPREFFVITLSSTVPSQPTLTTRHHEHLVRHEFISKFRGLQATISEVRFFLEMRRCRQDVMDAATRNSIHSMGEVARSMMDIQRRKKTGMLVVLSEDSPVNVRWAFQLFFLKGKLVKTDHSLESAVLFPTAIDEQPLEKIFTLASLSSKYQLNAPSQLCFFALHPSCLLRELQQQATPSTFYDE